LQVHPHFTADQQLGRFGGGRESLEFGNDSIGASARRDSEVAALVRDGLDGVASRLVHGSNGDAWEYSAGRIRHGADDRCLLRKGQRGGDEK
jgi:hypothetical protein